MPPNAATSLQAKSTSTSGSGSGIGIGSGSIYPLYPSPIMTLSLEWCCCVMISSLESLILPLPEERKVTSRILQYNVH